MSVPEIQQHFNHNVHYHGLLLHDHDPPGQVPDHCRYRQHGLVRDRAEIVDDKLEGRLTPHVAAASRLHGRPTEGGVGGGLVGGKDGGGNASRGGEGCVFPWF